MDKAMQERFDRQNAEFDAAANLAVHYKRIQMTPPVDDDYPEVRHGYDSAARQFVTAALLNGMFNQLSSEVRHAMRTELAKIPLPPNPPRDFMDIYRNGCNTGCDVDEAEGGVVDHCLKCCHEMVAAIKRQKIKRSAVDPYLRSILRTRTGDPIW